MSPCRPDRFRVDRWMLALFASICLCGTALAQKQGGSITVGLELDVTGFDPLKVGVYDTSGNMVAAALFDTLTGRDAEGKATPRLALSWTHSDDYKTWTFKLRPGVEFHDGSPFNAQAVKWNFDRQKDPANKCRCAFYIAYINRVEVLDDLTVVYRLKDPSMMLPEMMAPPTPNNVFHSPAAVAAKGDDYNRNPVGTGPFMLKSWTAGDRIVLERNPNYWNAGHPRLERLVFKPLPDGQSRFASLQSGEADIIWDDEYDHEASTRPRPTSASPCTRTSARARRCTRSTPGCTVRRPARAPGPGDGDRPQEDVAGDPVAYRDRRSTRMATAHGSSASDDAPCPRPGQGARADQGLRQAGVVQDDRRRLAARSRDRTGDAAVLEARRRHDGASTRSTRRRSCRARFRRQFQLTPWRIIDLADPDPQMYANFRTGSPVALANYSNPALDEMLERARMTADMRSRNADYCEIGRMINSEAIWFWTFQNTYYAITKARLKGLPECAAA